MNDDVAISLLSVQKQLCILTLEVKTQKYFKTILIGLTRIWGCDKTAYVHTLVTLWFTSVAL